MHLGEDSVMAYGLIRLRKDRKYSEQEVAEVRCFNRKVVENAFPELQEFFTILEARPYNVVIDQLPDTLSAQYDEMIKRFS